MASAASMSRNGHADCTRTRSSSRCGRPQRGTQAARTPTARFGSRGSSGAARSLSGTRCRRPSSEVELRVELCATAATSIMQDAGVDLVHNCAVGFVCDLIDDAVDEITDDLVHYVDDVHPSTPSPAVTPMKLKLPLNDAQLVLSPADASILDEVDEDEGICEAAAIFTARVAEEAIAAIPASPSWSLHVNAQNNASLDSVARQLDLGAAYEQDIDDFGSCDGYEEVYSLASEDEQESDDEHETMAYVKMAVRLAQTAVSRGCTNFAEEDDPVDAQQTPEEIMYERMEYYNAQASPRTEQRQTPYAPRLQAYYNRQASPRMEQQQTSYASSPQAKALARQALCAALLGRPSVFGESTEAETPENVEFLGEEPSCGDELSFDFASCILDGAMGQAADTWAKQDSGESKGEQENPYNEYSQTMEEEEEELRLQAMETLSSAVHTGKLEAALKQMSQEREVETLKAKTIETLQNAAVQRQMAHQTDELVLLREKVQDTLLKAAQAGKLTAVLKASSEAAELDALKMKVRNTLCKAAMEGRLSSTLHEVAPVVSELEIAKEKVRTALAKGLQNGQLAKIFSELKTDEFEIDSTPLSAQIDSTKREAPATPTRTRHRVIGGVVRAPAIDLELDLPSASPTSASRSDSTTTRRRHSKSGKKSLKEEMASQGAPACDRPASSKAGARLRAASTSAMAMDLGPSSSQTSAPSSSPLRNAFAPSALSLEPKMRVSASLGALPSLKTSKAGFLPIISTGKKNASSESIAWSMHMSKPARWGNTGLHGSASMVF